MKDVKISLKDQLVYKWTKHPQEEFYLRGNPIYQNKYLSILDFTELILSGFSICNFKEIVNNLNGHFAFVFYKNEQLFAVNDCVSSFPLFYLLKDKFFEVSDDPLKMSNGKYLTVAERDQFISSGFTFNENILNSESKRLQSGSILSFSNNTLEIESYHIKKNDRISEKATLLELEQKFETVLAAVFENIYQKYKGNQILIPLSGGLDSRLILAKLKEAGHQNIRCFTYGQKGSFEEQIAAKVCKRLEVGWQFIPFDEEVLDFYFSDKYKKYSDYAYNACSLPYEQDFLALQVLKNRFNWGENDLIVSGFGADVLAGSWLPSDIAWKDIDISTEGLIFYIRNNKKFFLSESLELNQEFLKEQLNQYFNKFVINSKETFLAALNYWGFDHRISKYQVNGMRAFEFARLNWSLPFCNKSYFDFWMNEVPIDQKRDKLFYKNFIDEKVFKPLGIDIYYEGILHQKPNDGIITKIKNWTPKPIKEGIKAMIPRKNLDVYNFDLLCDKIWEKLSDGERKQFKKDRYNLNVLEAVFIARHPRIF